MEKKIENCSEIEKERNGREKIVKFWGKCLGGKAFRRYGYKGHT